MRAMSPLCIACVIQVWVRARQGLTSLCRLSSIRNMDLQKVHYKMLMLYVRKYVLRCLAVQEKKWIVRYSKQLHMFYVPML